MSYSLRLAFENIALPPFNDILVLTRQSPYGKIGIMGSLNLLQPDHFEIIEVENDLVEALVINKRILKRIPAAKVVEILQESVFPYIVKGEIVKVDFTLKMHYDSIDLNMEEHES
ncbi:hypothetical protein JW979_08340 [bacterium]|nr:hypothetical protein [candidate division CSSED10-310 bacterium]